MVREKVMIPPLVFLLLGMATLLLVTCTPETLMVGVEPTPTTTPTPTPAAMSYVNEEYGFGFRYRETWTLLEEPGLIKLSQDGVVLYISYAWTNDPDFRPMGGRSGMPAGDLIYGGKVTFLGEVIPVELLEYERKNKLAIYGGGRMARGELLFSVWLEGDASSDYAALDIAQDVQSGAKEILESFDGLSSQDRPSASPPKVVPRRASYPAAHCRAARSARAVAG
jgi:hypothetical protein